MLKLGCLQNLQTLPELRDAELIAQHILRGCTVKLPALCVLYQSLLRRSADKGGDEEGRGVVWGRQRRQWRGRNCKEDNGEQTVAPV